MPSNELIVYRERLGMFEEAGIVGVTSDGNLEFAYSESYLQNENAQSISHALPLKSGAQASSHVKSFFDGLLPEGSMRRVLSASFHASEVDSHALLARLNDESAGALVFKSADEDPTLGRFYEPLEESDFARFAASPQEFAPRVVAKSRLSLAGAQLKIGLYFDKTTGSWLYPRGTAPTSHIVKACDGSFPFQTLNEAICMTLARNLGFETARCELIAVDGFEPLLSVERFDRIDAGGDYLHRLHQEDFFQAMPLFSNKYEPTDGHYANRCARLISEECANPFGDKMMLFSRLLLDWAVGNADNHLKNHSILWSDDWSSKTLSPLYDITCTTVYPGLDKEMGVSFGGSRRVDEVTRTEIAATAKSCGVGEKHALAELDEIIERFPHALRLATDEICAQGFDVAEQIGAKISDSFYVRKERMVR